MAPPKFRTARKAFQRAQELITEQKLQDANVKRALDLAADDEMINNVPGIHEDPVAKLGLVDAAGRMNTYQADDNYNGAYWPPGSERTEQGTSIFAEMARTMRQTAFRENQSVADRIFINRDPSVKNVVGYDPKGTLLHEGRHRGVAKLRKKYPKKMRRIGYDDEEHTMRKADIKFASKSRAQVAQAYIDTAVKNKETTPELIQYNLNLLNELASRYPE